MLMPAPPASNVNPGKWGQITVKASVIDQYPMSDHSTLAWPYTFRVEYHHEQPYIHIAIHNGCAYIGLFWDDAPPWKCWVEVGLSLNGYQSITGAFTLVPVCYSCNNLIKNTLLTCSTLRSNVAILLSILIPAPTTLSVCSGIGGGVMVLSLAGAPPCSRMP